MSEATGHTAAVEELLEDFEFLGDWEERYQYLIDLGRHLPDMPESDKSEENRVRGCQATVWMTARMHQTDPPTLQLRADADAHIVKGLIAVLLRLYDGRSPRQILEIDPNETFKRMNLEAHLSPTRRNGLHAMVKRVRELADQHANGYASP